MSAKVRDVMTTRVVAVREGASFKDIATMLRRHRVSAFLAEVWHVQGVVSVRDRLSYPPAAHRPQSLGPLF